MKLSIENAPATLDLEGFEAVKFTPVGIASSFNITVERSGDVVNAYGPGWGFTSIGRSSTFAQTSKLKSRRLIRVAIKRILKSGGDRFIHYEFI